MEATSLTVDEVRPHLDALERQLRHLFFEGGRHIALTPAQREALLRHGLPGLLDAAAQVGAAGGAGDAAVRRPATSTARTARRRPPGRAAEAFRDWIDSGRAATSYDSIIGSVGGGNHFAELQYVSQVHDGAAAYAWGLAPGRVVLMVHSGSLSLGHQANATGQDQARALWPKGVPAPAQQDPADAARRGRRGPPGALSDGVRQRGELRDRQPVLPGADDAGRVSPPCAGDVDAQAWCTTRRTTCCGPSADGTVVHRKGATPAGGPTGDPHALGRARHRARLDGCAELPPARPRQRPGARQRLPRRRAQRPARLGVPRRRRRARRVPGGVPGRHPAQPPGPAVAGRRDIIDAWRRDLKQEAPWAYKEVGAVVQSLEGAGVAMPVAELRPLLTVKG